MCIQRLDGVSYAPAGTKTAPRRIAWQRAPLYCSSGSPCLPTNASLRRVTLSSCFRAAARHLQRTHTLHQPRPTPARRFRVGLRLVPPVLAGRGEDRPTQMTVWRQTATRAHQVEAWQGHERRQRLEEFHW
jgi:hypothetical protein